MYRNMLVPLDGSELAEEVFPYAEELAGRLDLDLFFLNVCPPNEAELVPVRQAYLDQKTEMVWSRIGEIRTQIGAPANIKTIGAVGRVVVGNPAEEILKFAEENKMDIILMATRGRSGIKPWALGSVAYKVLHASKVPVWLVRGRIPRETIYDEWPRRTILVPLDRSPLAEAALPHAEALAKQRGLEAVEVLLLNVCDPEVFYELVYYTNPGYPPAAPLNYDEYVRREISRAVEESRRYLEKVAARMAAAGVNTRTEVLVGSPAEELIKYTGQNHFQLIVMTSHGHSGFKHLVFGSVAEKIVLQGRNPVFVIMAES
jgi:nucleotide-binding universal stress UspA family protein